MPTEPEVTWEAKPRRSIAERIASAAAVHGVMFREGRGGIPELTAHDWVAAMSGSSDPLGEKVCAARYTEDYRLLPSIVRALDAWGWERWRRQRSKHPISVPLHEALSTLAANEFVHYQRLNRDQRARALGVGNGRWAGLQNHFADLVGRLHNGEARVLAHVARRIR